ncbi:MAG: hypothetical protein R3B82_14315 [Sandaracinaceae bacterium]
MPRSIQIPAAASESGRRSQCSSCRRRSDTGRSAKREWYCPSQRSQLSISGGIPKKRSTQRPY